MRRCPVRHIPLLGWLAAAIVLGLAPAHAQKEDWNFSPTDYQNLTSGGGDLSYDGDSDWFPSELKDNLKATLKKVLDPKTKPANTDGVNTKDFYHGHVVCPKPCTDAQTAAKEAYYKAEKNSEKEAMGETASKVTADNMAKWKQAVKAMTDAASTMLKACLGKGCGVVYHTYEASGPPMKVGDPRRNLYTPNEANATPAGFKPPDENNASSYSDNYCVVLQFAFLVDKKGHIHVVTGSTKELSAVTGVPPND